MDEFQQVQAEQRPGYTGWWTKVIPQLDEDRRASLDQALHDRDISHSTISIVLKRWGFEVSPQAVGHFRRRYVD